MSETLVDNSIHWNTISEKMLKLINHSYLRPGLPFVLMIISANWKLLIWKRLGNVVFILVAYDVCLLCRHRSKQQHASFKWRLFVALDIVVGISVAIVVSVMYSC